MKKTAYIKFGLAILAVALIAQLGWLLYVWLAGATFGLGKLIWLGVVVAIAIAASVLCVIYRKTIWQRDPQSERLRALNLAARQQFKQIRMRARSIDRNLNNTPWHLFLAMQKQDSATVMAELGYVSFGDPVVDKGLVFTTWTSPTAVAYRIEIEAGTDLSFDLLDAVLRQLFRLRPNLALNAAFVEYELASLMQTSALETANLATMNRILNVAAERFGLDLPVHVALSGLNQLPDLSRAALLTGHLGDGVIFGGFLPEEEPDIAARVDKLFDELVRSLSAAQFNALQKQMLPEFSTALVNAPFQMSMLQTQLKSRMAALARALPPRQNVLNLQSIVFIGARDKMDAVDPLTQVTGPRFFTATPQTTHAAAAADSVTTENAGLLAAAYHREGFLVPPNKRQALRQSINAGVWTLGLCALVGGFGFAVWQNYRAYSAVNSNMEEAFDTYFASLSGVSTDSDFLVERVLKLQPIRDGLMGYSPLDAQRFRQFLPSPSHETLYRALYEEELTQGLQDALISFLEKDIFAFNSVADGVELVHLASVEAQLFTDQRRFSAELTEYFADGLAEEGEVSGAFQTQFRDTLSDLFALNQPPAVRNEDLRVVVAKTLAGLDTADLLYQALMRRSAYAERQDLRQLIGPRFFEVFEPIRDAEVYLVPRGFTRAGFDQLFEDGEMPELAGMVNRYETVIGELDSATENAILRSVAQRYTADYIAKWTAFVGQLVLRTAKDWGDAQILMQALTNPSENPVDRLVEAVSDNTDISVFLPPVPTGEEGEDSPPQLAPASASAEAATAYNIRTAFRTYLDALRKEPGAKNQFDLFLGYARDVTLWLDEAATASNGAGSFLFEQFKTAEAANPLAVLNGFVLRSELDIIRNFGREIVATLDARAMQYVYDYIDTQWQREILTPHGANLTQAYPFNPESSRDFPLAEFVELFGAEGKLAMFEATYLAPFQNQAGRYQSRASFVLTGHADLSQGAKQTFERFRQMSETLFVDGNSHLEFDLRTGYMSSDFSRMEVTSGITLYQFRHGPVVWSEQSWPVAGLQDSDLTLRIFNRSRAVLNQTFTGPWSWFRLVQSGSVGLNPSLGLAETVFDLDSGTAGLQLNVAERFNPFARGFFSDIALPTSLFDVAAADFWTEPLAAEPAPEAPSEALLNAWLRGDREAEDILTINSGRSLSAETRRAIQIRLQATGYYQGPIDGIIGYATQQALFDWRDAQPDRI